MNTDRVYYPCIILFLIVFFSGCTASEQVVRESRRGDSGLHPSWYMEGQPVQSDSSGYEGYATVLASDSARALQKVQRQARLTIAKSVSEQLESIRRETVSEISGLDNRSFIQALRNAEVEIEQAIAVVEVTAIKQPNNSGYRGYAKSVAARNELVSRLDQSLASHARQWREMKNSKAFSTF